MKFSFRKSTEEILEVIHKETEETLEVIVGVIAEKILQGIYEIYPG